MTFSQGGSFGGGRVQSRRGGGRGAAAGGGIGIGVIILFILSGITGQDLTGLAPALDGGGMGPGTGGTTTTVGGCTAEQANVDPVCRLSAATDGLDTFWAQALPEQAGVTYVAPGVVEFQGSTTTACGPASSSTGPFYCPPDQTVYLDLGFYDVLRSRFGASGGSLAELYVLAHEFGHHIEQVTGLLAQADRSGTGPTSDAVRIELTADCLAGMWIGHAANTVDPDTGVTYLEPITEQQLADALSAAAAVGDDRIQEAATGTVNPEAWTHGSGEQRQRWFTIGYDGGTLQDCNALQARSL